MYAQGRRARFRPRPSADDASDGRHLGSLRVCRSPERNSNTPAIYKAAAGQWGHPAPERARRFNHRGNLGFRVLTTRHFRATE